MAQKEKEKEKERECSMCGEEFEPEYEEQNICWECLEEEIKK